MFYNRKLYKVGSYVYIHGVFLLIYIGIGKKVSVAFCSKKKNSSRVQVTIDRKNKFHIVEESINLKIYVSFPILSSSALFSRLVTSKLIREG